MRQQLYSLPVQRACRLKCGISLTRYHVAVIILWPRVDRKLPHLPSHNKQALSSQVKTEQHICQNDHGHLRANQVAAPRTQTRTALSTYLEHEYLLNRVRGILIYFFIFLRTSSRRKRAMS